MQTETTKETVKKTSQEIKVIAVNTLNEFAEKFYNYEKAHFDQFIGIDIFKVDGSIKQKYQHDKIDFDGLLSDGTHYNAHYWMENRGYGSFDLRVKICINGGTYDVKPATAFCQYEEMTLTLFNITDGKLTEAKTDITHLQKRYDVNILNKIADNIKEAANKYNAVEDTMPYRFKDVYWIERLTR